MGKAKVGGGCAVVEGEAAKEDAKRETPQQPRGRTTGWYLQLPRNPRPGAGWIKIENEIKGPPGHRRRRSSRRRSPFYMLYKAFVTSMCYPKLTISVKIVNSCLSLPSTAVKQPSSQSSSMSTARMPYKYNYLASMSDSNSAFHSTRNEESNDVGKVPFT